jgi:glycosyltransferase involved in cell wall biosynthesis
MELHDAPLPRVDLVIPFHQENKYLREAFFSGLRSQNVNVNIIAVDDSNNGLGKTLNDEIAHEMVEIIKSRGNGYLQAMKTGVQETRAEYVAFLDSDDLSEPDRLIKQIRFIEDEKLDCCSCRIVRIDKESRIIGTQGLFGSNFEKFDSDIRLLFGPYGADSSILIKGDMLRRTWSSHSEYPAQFADYAWLLSNISKMKMKHLTTASYLYRSHEFQMSRQKVENDKWLHIHPLWLSHLHSLNEKLPLTSKMNISPEVSAAIAFPSSLPRLSKPKRKELREFTKLLVVDTRQMEVSKLDVASVHLRTLFGTRGRYLAGYFYGPRLLINIGKMLLLGIVPRKNG